MARRKAAIKLIRGIRMAHPPRSKPPIDFDLASTLAHHDAEIVTLGGRMTGVEQGMRSLEGTVQSGFGQISNTLAEMRGKSGPGLGDVLKIVLSGGALVGMSAAAITMLVNSFMKPELIELKDISAVLSTNDTIRTASEREELERLRELRRTAVEEDVERLQQAIGKLEEKLGWMPEVKRAGGKGF
jgi:hypothetical protein